MVHYDTPLASPLRAEGATPLLSPRQLLALQLLSHGYSEDQIGDLIGIAAYEVDQSASRAAGILGASTVTEAVLRARRRGLIE